MGTIDAADWQRLSALLDEALALDGAARAAWLATLAQRDSVLAARLERALAQEGPTLPAATHFERLLAPALQGQDAALNTEELTHDITGTRLGAWQLEAKIGQGGMGEVWRARRADGLYEAQAAIKLLRSDLPAALLSARFARERAVLARLHHPAIARLLDAGVDQGRAYLVLELLAGRTLTDHVRAQQPPLAGRVRLLMRVAEAVEHAHAQLIVHRDLKPSNVLVTASGKPKLLDFGIAGLLSDATDTAPAASDITRHAGRGLTPNYAAPEQITGEPIGTSADVFSLGVMLFELASGQLPLGQRRAGRAEAEHAVLHGRPLRLTEALALPDDPLGPGCPEDAKKARGDLEAVAAKALRKTPGERYGSVRAFSEDLRRWLDHVPVSVRRDDWRHRSQLWLRRHAVLATAVAGVTLALLGGLAASTWQWRRAENAAERSARVTRYLTELLASANPDQNAGQMPSVLRLLDTSRGEVAKRFAEDPDTLEHLLGVYGETYNALNRFDIAIPLVERRITLAQANFGRDDPRTVQARIDLARIYTSQGSPTRVLEILEPLRELVRARAGGESADYANLLYQLIVAYARVGRVEDARRVIAQARPIEAKIYKPQDFEAVFFDNYVQVVLLAEGHVAQAVALLEGTRPSWATAPKRFGRFVLVLRRNLLVAQMRLMQTADIDAPAAASVAETNALLGRGNDVTARLRVDWARWLADNGRLADAVTRHDEVARDLRSAEVEYPALRLPRDAARLHIRALAAADPPAVLRTELLRLGAAVDGTPALADLPRSEARLSLASAALLLGEGARAGLLLAQVRADPAAALATNWQLAGRVAQLEGQAARLRGDLASSRDLLAGHAARLAAAGEPRLPTLWTARLDLAFTLLLLGDAAGAAAQLQAADAARPLALSAGCPQDLLRRHLQARLDAPGSAEARASWAALAQALRRDQASLLPSLAGFL